jgi:transcriptional regulator with XRE-family HTH domain
MHTTLQLLELAKHQLALKHHLTLPMSDYRLADLLRIDERTVSNWRRGRAHIGAQFAPRFADATGLAVEYIYACIEHERASSPEARAILKTIAKRFGSAGTAASILLAFLLLFSCPNPLREDDYSHTLRGEGKSDTLYIMRTRMRTVALLVLHYTKRLLRFCLSGRSGLTLAVR